MDQLRMELSAATAVVIGMSDPDLAQRFVTYCLWPQPEFDDEIVRVAVDYPDEPALRQRVHDILVELGDVTA